MRKLLIGIVLAVFVFWIIGSLNNSNATSQTLSEPITVDTTAVSVDTMINTPTANDNKWQYDSSIDKMTSKTSKFATITSNESLDLDFPYDGVNWAYLTLRKKNGTLNIYLKIDKGQIHGGYENNYIEVRFDEDKPITFSYSEPEDNSSDLIFIDNETKFLSKLKKSKKTLIGIPLYQNGTQILEFNTENLEW
ncbi:hypothetical protein EOD40_04735 [Flavobacterium sufflavum]|uniref:Uncharacterized protein n=1 Tax=Flavobacterium sufflavum TaxID=1921138 RepID=A0A3S2WG74_9FLAO|nr:hypothetical protein [Flavobacterium sufflavum]RVT78544.1 hypothetical protein EOD40_04735 [Flavobacterium sufflavum]